MTITASAWLNGLVEKKIIMENHYKDFELLFEALNQCNRVVPGFEHRELKCADFLSDEIRRVHNAMNRYNQDQRK